MKRTPTFLLLSLIFTFVTCKKDETAISVPLEASSDLIQAAKKWHQQKVNSVQYDFNFTTSGVGKKATGKKILEPNWNVAKSRQWFRKNNAVVVPVQEFNLDNKDIGFYRFFIFHESGGKISSGRIVEIYGDKRYVSGNKDLLVSLYNSKLIEGFEGSIITYDMHYRHLRSRTFIDGKVVTANAGLGIKASSKTSGVGSNRIFSCEGQTTEVKDLQCYAVYWIRRYTDGSELWTFLYTYCDGGAGCGGSAPGGGGGGTEPTVPVSAFSSFPTNPIDGEVYVLIYPTGSRWEFTYNSDLNLWLSEEVTVLQDLGYTVSLNADPSGPPQFAGGILSTMWVVAGVEPTPFGEAIMLGATVVYSAYYLYQLDQWYQATKNNNDYLYCLNMYVGCQLQTPSADCDFCLNFCHTQGYWQTTVCPGVTPVIN